MLLSVNRRRLYCLIYFLKRLCYDMKKIATVDGETMDFTNIKLIIWDLDETLWKGTLSDNDTVIPVPEFTDFLNNSLDRGIVHSICSKNDFDSAAEHLRSLGLWDLFVFPSINWEPKGERIKSLITDMKLRPANVLFVDDNTSNLREARFYCPEIQTCTPEELLRSLDGIYAIQKTDPSRPRLEQYRLLEQKNKTQSAFSSNEDFLMSCNIRVVLHDDCLSQLDRIHDLILRSNQLNYTKFRQSKDDLAAALTAPGTRAQYVTVQDAFGDYGIVGFYMMVDGKVLHYLFSCRTLGMLVEQYVYMQIGCPRIQVEGDVITQLNTTDTPPWINQNETSSAQNAKTTTGDQVILFKGPCDISQIFSFMEQTPGIKTDFTYVNDMGITVEGHNHTAQAVTALLASAEDKEKMIRQTPWLDQAMLDGSAWKGNDAVVFSLLTDGNLGIYQHKETGWQIALCEKAYDLTDQRTWDDYINKRIFTSQITFTETDLKNFADRYQFIDNSDGAVTMKNLDTIYGAISPGTKLILMLGSEVPYELPCKPSYHQRHSFHKTLNDKVKLWAVGKKNVHLIEISNYITSQKDYTDHINHFPKRVYYRIAQDVHAILNQEQPSVKIRGKLFLYYSDLEAKLKGLIKNEKLKAAIKKLLGK